MLAMGMSDSVVFCGKRLQCKALGKPLCVQRATVGFVES